MSENVQQDELKSFFAKQRKDHVVLVNTVMRPGTRRRERDGSVSIHHGQEKWLRNAFHDFNVLVPGNRYGKSVVGGHRHLCMAFNKVLTPFYDWEQWLEEPYETLASGYSAEQANIVFRNVRRIAGSKLFKPFIKDIKESPYPKIILWNNSIINIRSAHDDGKYIDGFAYKYISLDEAGWIGNDLMELINGVLLMRMAGGGILDLIGTPKGRQQKGLWYYANRGFRGVPGYYTQKGSSFDNPFLSAEDLRKREEYLRISDPKKRAQVIEGAFVDDTGLTFTSDQLDNLFVPGMRVHTDPIDGHRYVQAWDLGRTTDWTVGFTVDITYDPPWPVVDFQRLNKVPWEEIYNIIGRVSRMYNVYRPRIDATGPQGDVVEEELWKRGVTVEPFKISNGQIKIDLINSLQNALDYGRTAVGMTSVPDEAGNWYDVPLMEEPDPTGKSWGLLRCASIPQVVDELGVYTMPDKDLTQDCVMALAMTADIAIEMYRLKEPVFGGLYG